MQLKKIYYLNKKKIYNTYKIFPSTHILSCFMCCDPIGPMW